MERYGAISSIAFGEVSLSLPMSVRVFRRAEADAAGCDSDRFATSAELAQPVIGLEVRTRDTAAAEGLSLGQAGLLVVELAGTRAGQTGRSVSIDQAVLTGIELHYAQAAPASVKLTFLAEATDGNTDPFFAQEAQQ